MLMGHMGLYHGEYTQTKKPGYENSLLAVQGSFLNDAAQGRPWLQQNVM
jgi:hypothetical protein